MNNTEQTIFFLVAVAGAFIFGVHHGAKQAVKATAAAQPQSATDWLMNWGQP